MSISDAQYLAWLEDSSAIRTMLIEADYYSGGSELTEYASTVSYTSLPTDTNPNRKYPAMALNGLSVSETFPPEGQAALTTGDTEFANVNGERESWMARVFTNRGFRCYIGDIRWSRDDFRKFFDGTQAPVSRKSTTSLALRQVSKLNRLNGPMTETKFGNGTLAADTPYPLGFGENFNVTPKYRPDNGRWYVHDGAIERIIEVRMSGLPVSYTADLATGSFIINVAITGPVTCSFQGDKFGGVYRKTVGSIIQRIATGYGPAASRFVAGDLDATQLAAFEAAHPQTVGIYIADRANVLPTLQQLASSLGSQVILSRLGLLQIVQFGITAGGPAITDKWMVTDPVPGMVIDPVGAIKLGFCKNWTPQPNLATSLPAEHMLYMAGTGLSTSVATASQATHKLSTDAVQRNTLLLDPTEANTERDRLAALWGVPRHPYTFTAGPIGMQLVIGSCYTIYHRLNGMAAGVPCVITSLQVDPTNFNVQVGILV